MKQKPEAAEPVVEPVLLRPAEVAIMIGSSKGTVYDLIHAGQLPAVSLPSRSPTPTRHNYRVLKVDVEAWIARMRRKGVA